MEANDDATNPAADENEEAADENQENQDDDDGGTDDGHERIWSSPIGTGDPIPFDPTKFLPPMSKEEIEKLQKRDKK